MKRLVLPGLMRMAIETAARDGYLTRAMEIGTPLAEAEDRWNRTHTTWNKVALMVPDLAGWQHEEGRHYRSRALGIAATGPHEGLRGDISKAVWDLKSTVTDLLDDQT